MSLHRVDIRWSCEGDFGAGQYSRAHEWQFDGGAVVRASASPDIVPPPWSDAAAVDPEEAFVAAISSCHMLWFLDLARRAGHSVVAYHDAAVGHMKNDAGTIWLPKVELNISVTFDGASPDRGAHEALHHKAHDACFIANSVKSEIVTNIL